MKTTLFSLVLSGALAGMTVPALADPGADAFSKQCAKCHGKDGKGATVMGKKLQIRNLAIPEIQSKSDTDLEKQVTEGNAKKKMPAYKDKLSADEIKAVVAFVRSLKN